MRQSVLSEDVRSWARHRRAGYGFEDEDEEGGRAAVRRRRGQQEEEEEEEGGLDEAGEAPPAYVKEPDRVHLEGRGGGEGVELRGMARPREMAGLEGKPPDYEEMHRPTG